MKSAVYRYPLAVLICLIALGQSRVMAEERLEKKQEETFQFSPKGSLKLHNLSGPVKVIGWDRDQCEIKAVKSAPVRESAEKTRQILNQVTIEIKKSETGVEISTRYPDESLELKLEHDFGKDAPAESTGEELGILGAWLGRLTTFISSLGTSLSNQMSLKMPVDVAYEIHVPARTDVTVNNASGDLELSGLDGNLQSNVANGSVRLVKLNGKSMANTVNGEIIVENPGGILKLNTINGQVQVALDEAYSVKEIYCNTVNGQVTLSLPGSAGASLDLSAVVGAIEVDDAFKFKGDETSKRVSGKLNDGGPLFKANVVNGGIRIKAM
ncbi:MAG: hypothetical protein A3F83_13965 [Candidatus Glassbacteria bacterium RIFCSPLOWO2_12_FULL_58_11]|uniref:DUF4097 domain-containing protein n=1 Tax=Candidatus Glassbacteria bacterium RIFCSPLOWO2_12_FULL_58_11 TaxID=1817867 RepID=A0A1F5YR91_9BACT|nr:MAG: hypothetical protein A3F83_13965 [Candidatus Glassbacteria bacterium RIFCSPLOWO2_12_FULL_58_11]